ncbi:g10598 [Coccomyxa elongata]
MKGIGTSAYVARPRVAESVVPRAVLAVHAAFHTVYTVLATFARRWCLQQNIQRLQARKGWLSWQSLWDTFLNVLNGADAALHVCRSGRHAVDRALKLWDLLWM